MWLIFLIILINFINFFLKHSNSYILYITRLGVVHIVYIWSWSYSQVNIKSKKKSWLNFY
ncbi:hypothetical protein H8356DRAFT_1623040, partial [Neocallimastix lanati (nom. inval.)]